MGQNGGSHFQQFLGDINAFVQANRKDPVFGGAIELLGSAQESMLQAAMAFLQFSQSDKLALIPLNANRFLNMMSQLAIGWLLLEAGMIAEGAGKDYPPEHPERVFYEGKKASALWYARNVLPTVEQSAKMIAMEDLSAMELAPAAFGTAA